MANLSRVPSEVCMAQSFEDRLRGLANRFSQESAAMRGHTQSIWANDRGTIRDTGARLEIGMVPTSSGLLVPESAARPAQPIDQILTYLDGEEIFGQSIPLEAVPRMLSDVSAEQAAAWAAHWLAKLGHPRASRRTLDAE